MSKDTQVKKVGEDAPSWLIEAAKAETKSLDHVKTYRRVPVLRVIQAMTQQPALKAQFGEGSAILTPGNALVAKVDQPFNFVPLFSWTEFRKWADRNDKSIPAVQGSSYDHKSDIAIKARDKDRRYEGYSEIDTKTKQHKFEFRYIEHLIFAGMLYGEHEFAGTVCSLSFEKGEFWNGNNFCSSIVLRKVGGQTAPLWSQVWEFRVRDHKNKQDQHWWGLDYFTPEQAFISEDEAVTFEAAHEELAKQFAAKQIIVDLEDDGGESPTTDDSEM